MEETTSTRAYRGVSPDARRDDRRKRLLTAVVDLVAQHGRSAVTVRSVAAAAGIGPRFFYESFADTTDLVTTAYDELGADLVRGAVQAIEATPATGDTAADLQARARAAVASIVADVTGDARRGRYLLADDPSLAGRRDEFLRLVADALHEQTHAIGAELSRRQVQLCTVVVMAGAVELLRGLLDETLPVRADEIVDIVAAQLSSITAAVPGLISP